MIHSFNTDLAEQFGIEKAILLDHICYWIAENERNEKNFINGRTWSYNTIDGMCAKFHYIPRSTLARHLKSLCDMGVLICENFNESPFDRTKWYALSDEYLYLLDDYTHKGNGTAKAKKINNDNSICQNEIHTYTNMGQQISQNEICINKITTNSQSKTNNTFPNGKEANLKNDKCEQETEQETGSNLPEFIDKELWAKFKKYKRERNEHIGAMQMSLMFDSFVKWHKEGIDVNECIRQSIANGYKGVFVADSAKPKRVDIKGVNANGESELMKHNLEAGKRLMEFYEAQERKGNING